MNLLDQHSSYNIQFVAQNEGKIKYHESCNDFRAWSHDLRQRDRYLREWIKCDMPLCVVPVSTLVGFFKTMTCKSRGRVTPRCHPDCKSKVILDSITKVCEAIRECVKDGINLEKFSCEEEFETSHWPYERCLDALKNIRLFWKILLEKVFAVTLRKEECLEHNTCNECGNVRDVAKNWARDMVYQANFVKKLTPQIIKANEKISSKSCLKRTSSCCFEFPASENKYKASRRPNKVIICDPKQSCLKDKTHKVSPFYSNKCVSALLETTEVSCNTSGITSFCEYCDYQEMKAKYECLVKEYESQKCELERLKKENKSLRCELKNACTECPSWKPHQLICGTALLPAQDANVHFPEPFEATLDDYLSEQDTLKDAESELLITMKNCSHESYRHVSLLQVLHKTNAPCLSDNIEGSCHNGEEDPVQLLTKVQKTLGAMVNRELVIAQSKSKCDSNEIKATFHRSNLRMATRN